MKLTFLCVNHREWLSSRPDQAIHWCANSCETGRYLCQQQRLEEALPYVGCAFEAAEILLTTREIKPAESLPWFLHTLAELTRTLRKLGRFEDCKNVNHLAVERLQQELRRNRTLKTTIALEFNRIAKELKDLSNNSRAKPQQFSGKAQYCWSTATFLNQCLFGNIRKESL